MNIRIVTDSCVDHNKDVFGHEENMERVPFKIIIENEEMIDKYWFRGTQRKNEGYKK